MKATPFKIPSLSPPASRLPGRPHPTALFPCCLTHLSPPASRVPGRPRPLPCSLLCLTHLAPPVPGVPGRPPSTALYPALSHFSPLWLMPVLYAQRLCHHCPLLLPRHCPSPRRCSACVWKGKAPGDLFGLFRMFPRDVSCG